MMPVATLLDMPESPSYVALGSSYGSGPGLDPRAAGSPRRAGRSERNYAHLLAARLGLTLDDQTYSGETVAQITGEDSSSRRAPQLDAVGPQTRLVTVTAGGNDVGYIPRLANASIPGLLRLPGMRRTVRELGDQDATGRAFAALGTRLSALCRIVAERSDAVVVLTDYLTLLPDDESVDTRPLSREIAAWGRDVAHRLSDTVAAVADAEGALFASAAEHSREHHAWSAEPWTSGFTLSLRGGAPYHPNAAGMDAVAELLEGLVRPRLADSRHSAV